ncbi:MAG: response regulator transcription factor [Thermoanaerobaculia bacterium]|nr:MAG: response regulator transcription factor [Thermoanaerobaculia bacterium]
MSETRAVLVADDEANLARGIAENLIAEGYRVTTVGDGIAALEEILRGGYDLVVLDVMMPGLDGFAVCEEARRQGSVTPILFLTARSGVDDRIRGLEAGGDDYLPKPFHLKELLLRVRVILRRWSWYAEGGDEAKLAFGGNEVDFRTFRARAFDGGVHQLTQKEAMILKALAERQGEVVSRDELLEKAWGYELYPSSRTVDNFILRLRKRFEPDPERPRYFHTMRGVGYRFTARGESE